MDLKTALKDKRLLYGVGLAAAAGGAVLWQRSKSGSSSTSTGGPTSTQPAYVGAGSVDTTGTDVASWLGNYSASLQTQYDQQQQQWAQWGQNLLDTLGQMSDTPNVETKDVQVVDGSWLSNILQQYNISAADLLRLNPTADLRQSDLEGWVGPNNPATGANLRLSFYGNQTLKVPV